jgi:hypothetical protein
VILCRVGLSLPVINVALRALLRVNVRWWDEGEQAVGVADDAPAAGFVDGVVVEVAQEQSVAFRGRSAFDPGQEMMDVELGPV